MCLEHLWAHLWLLTLPAASSHGVEAVQGQAVPWVTSHDTTGHAGMLPTS